MIVYSMAMEVLTVVRQVVMDVLRALEARPNLLQRTRLEVIDLLCHFDNEVDFNDIDYKIEANQNDHSNHEEPNSSTVVDCSD